jgi:signal transduction histidine kinase
LVELQHQDDTEDIVRISVTDNGVGIKKKDQSKLFQLFGSIKDEKKKINTSGIGLGLVISKLIVLKFEGLIDFVSKYKFGSTFFFTIQLSPSEGSSQQIAIRQKKTSSKSIHLL